MSYEGYDQCLCKNGHLSEFDCSASYYDEDDRKCPNCGEEIVFTNSVDQTNGEYYGKILDLTWLHLQISPAKEEVCNLGHTHVMEEARYRVPTKEELNRFRMWYDSGSNTWKEVVEYYRRYLEEL